MNASKEDKGVAFIITMGFLVAISISFLAGLHIEKVVAYQAWEQSAIANGYGTYVLDAKGNTVFSWKVQAPHQNSETNPK